MSFQCLLRAFTDSMGFIVTVQEDKDVFKNKRKIFFNGREGFEQNLESVVGKKIGQDGNDEIIGGEDGIEI